MTQAKETDDLIGNLVELEELIKKSDRMGLNFAAALFHTALNEPEYGGIKTNAKITAESLVKLMERFTSDK